ncbi:exopolyphosphatase [Pancytospora epiphaga]|nr:exopolyphosphatase [Pancytospora epiphaga]
MTFETELDRFLKSCREKIKGTSITICMGSEACDLDSFVSSLVVAIHENAILVINLSRKILESKGDLMYFINHYNINLEHLIFLERPRGAFSLEARRLGTTFRTGKDEYKLTEKKVRLILTDHHSPVPELRDSVIELIIDHHILGERSLAASRIYADISVGSCCTLVSKYIGHTLFHSKFKKDPLFESVLLCRGVAEMLTVPIMVDTKNFKKVASHFDKGEFNKLKKLAKIKKRKINKFRKQIKKERLNDESLKTEVIVQKDYKAFSYGGFEFGIGTVKYPFKRWVDREAKEHGSVNSKHAGKYLEQGLTDFRRNQGLDFIAINRKAGTKRYFGIFNCPFERVLADENNFVAEEYKGFRYYKIPVATSRKLMVPIIKRLIDKFTH